MLNVHNLSLMKPKENEVQALLSLRIRFQRRKCIYISSISSQTFADLFMLILGQGAVGLVYS